MRFQRQKLSVLLAAIGCVVLLVPAARAAWWERGAATWCYKDDWKGLALTGARDYQKTFRLEEAATSGWIVLWGSRGYRLTIGGKLVGENVDGSLVDDYSLAPFLGDAQTEVTLAIEGAKVCAEGELVTASGKRIPFATGDDWETSRGKKPRTETMEAERSAGAFDRARNARLLSYNDEERGKTAIAKVLARLQRMEDQSIFLLRRFRPAEEIVSLDPEAPWQRAERHARPLVKKARSIASSRAIPAQKAGQYAEAQTAAVEAGVLTSGAEQAVAAALSIYRAEREMTHLENCADLASDTQGFTAGLDEIGQLARQARWDYGLGDFAAAAKTAGQLVERAGELRRQLAAPDEVVTTGSLDEFPESPFGWLNARALMGNDPGRWPFSVAPSAMAPIDLAGRWQFRTDPNDEGLDRRWHASGSGDSGWREILVPGPWEREGYTEDNLKSPGDCPYKLPDRRTGDKPYNGFAWYRKEVTIPAGWKDRDVVLAMGGIQNWAEVYVNGTAVSPGRLDPPAEQAVPRGLLRFGKKNLIAVRVYNHNNFGGVMEGPVAIYPAGWAPADRQTPGPLAWVTERTYTTPAGTVQQTLLAGALSPGVVVATEAPLLEVWGWEAKGYSVPSTASFVTSDGVQTARLSEPARLATGKGLAENWILLSAEDHDALVMLPRRPREVKWEQNALGFATVAIGFEHGPAQAAIVVLPAKSDVETARRWARMLRRYPVAASDVVTRAAGPDPLLRRHSLRYRYLELEGFGSLEPLTVAAVPMLASFALAHGNPRVRVEAAEPTGYQSPYAPYLVLQGVDRLEYEAQGVDRSKVMKGIGELFHSKPPDVFQQMAGWGCDHVRYAWAFHASWDMPLVKYMGGPIIEDNEAVWKRLDEVVDRCNAAGMQMMLTWFFNEDSPQRDAGGAVRNSTRYWRSHPDAQKNAFELWRRIAQRYADKPRWAVSYDFFNEPAYMNCDHWNEIVKELTAVIRSVDQKHMIVWESADGWAQPSWCLWMEPSGDPNTLYSFHRYGKHWGYAYDEHYPSYQSNQESKQIEPWLEAILFSIRHNAPIHCGEFGISMIQPDGDGLVWLDDYLAFFERFGVGWNWWNYSGQNVYRTGLAAGGRVSPNVAVLRKWFHRSGWGRALRRQQKK